MYFAQKNVQAGCVSLEGLSPREADEKKQDDPIRKTNEIKHSCWSFAKI